MDNTADEFAMPGLFLETRDRSVWPIRWMARLGVGLFLVLSGCNQNPTGTGSTAWTNPFAAPYGTSANPSSQQSLDDMRRQSQQQYQLAMEQQRQLSELEAIQRQYEQQMAQMRQQEQDAKAKAFQQEEQQEALVTQRAREFLGATTIWGNVHEAWIRTIRTCMRKLPKSSSEPNCWRIKTNS